jgi:hypothetical protein
MMETLSFPADHPALHTKVGKRGRGTIDVNSSSGCAVYGPYVDLPAGPCVARVTFQGPKRGRAYVDLAAKEGTRVLALREVDLGLLGDRPVELAVSLSEPLSQCEIRLYCRQDVQASISAVEFDLGDYSGVERLLRADLGRSEGGREGVKKGRDIEAGYIRGRGIEFGFLRQAILDDPDWIAAITAARGRSIVTIEKLMNLFLIVKYSEIKEGNIIEYGSFRGGGALFLAALAKRLRNNCKVFALDTYEGMPDTDEELDRHRAGGFADVDFPGLEQARKEEGLDNLVILRGLFQDTVEQIAPADRRFFLSHVDCDVYDSAVFSIEFSKRHAVPGSYITLDDPLASDCIGAMQAAEECLVQQGLFAEQVYPHFVYRYPPL